MTLRRFALWRAAVATVAVTALATLATWAAAMLAAPSPGASGAILATAIVLALGVVALALSLARVEPGVLSCHDGRWAFASERSPEQPVLGELVVAVDLGSFLLLTLSSPGARRFRRWLPIQRRGLEGDWHLLRCAVYSPPLVAPDAHAANEAPS